MYPRVVVDIGKLKKNIQTMAHLLQQQGISMMFVTKCFSAEKHIVDAVSDLDFEYFADSRIENLKSMGKTAKKKVLLRLPMLSETDEVVEYSDMCLISEMETITALNLSATQKRKVYDIILMMELGDLREGILEEDLDEYIPKILKLSNINLKGIGVNLTCYGSIIPDEKNLGDLVRIAKKVENTYDIKLDIISGGNSSSVYLALDGRLPKGINNLRLGESVLVGREAAYLQPIEGMHHDIFTLEAQIIELKHKNTYPTGNIGYNAFGEKIHYDDEGKKDRAILAIGKQDVDWENMVSLDERIRIFGSSSDHLIIDVTGTDYKLGDLVQFRLNYVSTLNVFTSKYVEKVYINEG